MIGYLVDHFNLYETVIAELLTEFRPIQVKMSSESLEGFSLLCFVPDDPLDGGKFKQRSQSTPWIGLLTLLEDYLCILETYVVPSSKSCQETELSLFMLLRLCA